ncbi:MAG: hypothetical protein NT031_13975, partial [Planctomycetota bacterium]|nr:hypothetical protein [Planctomycetota bacterium]
FDAIVLAEQVKDVLGRMDKMLPNSKAATGPLRAKLDSCLAVEPKRVAGEVPATGPAKADLNEQRRLAAEECKAAAEQFELAATATPEPKCWPSYTLSGLAWEKAYNLLAGRRLGNEAGDKQNAAGMAEARKAAIAAADKALTGTSGAENRKDSPFLAPALLLRARLDALK